MTRFSIDSLDGKRHRRDLFNSRSDALNHYLKKQASQDVRKRVAACFVAVSDDQRTAGYYTLASTSILLSGLPENIQNKLPRYPTVPAVLMGRLAVDRDFERQGLGSALLADALTRAANNEIAAYALLVNAKDQDKAGFYLHYGFIPMPESPLLLFMPLGTVRSVVG